MYKNCIIVSNLVVRGELQIMIKKLRTTITSIIFIFLLFPSVNVKATTISDNQSVDANKKWTIKFNHEIVLDDVSKQNINVLDSNGNNVNVVLNLEQDNKSIIVNAPVGGYEKGKSYKLVVGNKVHSKDNKKLKEAIVLNFNVKQLTTNDEIDITDKFTDLIFKNEVYKLLEKNISEPILYSDVKDIKSLKLQSLGINNLDGIEYFTALNYLDCSSNQLANLNLSKNTDLIKVDCNGNQLKTLDVSKNITLIELNCGNNPLLTNLNLNENIELTRLICYYNGLTSLDLSNNVALNYLNCSQNQLSNLDLSKNKELANLECRDNKLRKLDLSNNTKLIFLTCTSNYLTTIDRSQNKNLVFINKDDGVTLID